mgnify:CR=1 FL=1
MNRRLVFLLAVCLHSAWLLAPPSLQASVYEAREQSVRTFFSELSGPLGKPVVVSKNAAAKRISGTFDLRVPQQVFERVSRQMGLIWYSDGQAIYLYDAGEFKSSMMSLQTLTVAKLQAFLDLLIQLEPEAIQGHQLVGIAGLAPQLLVLAASGLPHRLERAFGQVTLARLLITPMPGIHALCDHLAPLLYVPVAPLDLGALLRVTQLLVNEAQEQGLATGLRTCLGCEYFRPFASGEREAPHVCAFLDKAFGDAELRVDCAEQRPAADEQRYGSVLRFRQPTPP